MLQIAREQLSAAQEHNAKLRGTASDLRATARRVREKSDAFRQRVSTILQRIDAAAGFPLKQSGTNRHEGRLVMPDRAVSDMESLPPIVLLLDDEPDILEMYSAHFQAEGVWVATAASAREGMASVAELRPDAVVTDIMFGVEPSGATFVEVLRSRADTSRIPLIVLTGRTDVELPSHVRRDADLFLRKPVAPSVLSANVHRLLESSQALRARSQRVRTRVDHLRGTSNQLLDLGNAMISAPGSRAARCPQCIEPLRWIESGTVNGTSFEYYDWCERGCGLYCFEVATGTPTKLA